MGKIQSKQGNYNVVKTEKKISKKTTGMPMVTLLKLPEHLVYDDFRPKARSFDNFTGNVKKISLKPRPKSSVVKEDDFYGFNKFDKLKNRELDLESTLQDKGGYVHYILLNNSGEELHSNNNKIKEYDPKLSEFLKQTHKTQPELLKENFVIIGNSSEHIELNTHTTDDSHYEEIPFKLKTNTAPTTQALIEEEDEYIEVDVEYNTKLNEKVTLAEFIQETNSVYYGYDEVNEDYFKKKEAMKELPEYDEIEDSSILTLEDDGYIDAPKPKKVSENYDCDLWEPQVIINVDDTIPKTTKNNAGIVENKIKINVIDVKHNEKQGKVNETTTNKLQNEEDLFVVHHQNHSLVRYESYTTDDDDDDESFKSCESDYIYESEDFKHFENPSFDDSVDLGLSTIEEESEDDNLRSLSNSKDDTAKDLTFINKGYDDITVRNTRQQQNNNLVLLESSQKFLETKIGRCSDDHDDTEKSISNFQQVNDILILNDDSHNVHVKPDEKHQDEETSQQRREYLNLLIEVVDEFISFERMTCSDDHGKKPQQKNYIHDNISHENNQAIEAVNSECHLSNTIQNNGIDDDNIDLVYMAEQTHKEYLQILKEICKDFIDIERKLCMDIHNSKDTNILNDNSKEVAYNNNDTIIYDSVEYDLKYFNLLKDLCNEFIDFERTVCTDDHSRKNNNITATSTPNIVIKIQENKVKNKLKVDKNIMDNNNDTIIYDSVEYDLKYFNLLKDLCKEFIDFERTVCTDDHTTKYITKTPKVIVTDNTKIIVDKNYLENSNDTIIYDSVEYDLKYFNLLKDFCSEFIDFERTVCTDDHSSKHSTINNTIVLPVENIHNTNSIANNLLAKTEVEYVNLLEDNSQDVTMTLVPSKINNDIININNNTPINKDSTDSSTYIQDEVVEYMNVNDLTQNTVTNNNNNTSKSELDSIEYLSLPKEICKDFIGYERTTCSDNHRTNTSENDDKLNEIIKEEDIVKQEIEIRKEILKILLDFCQEFLVNERNMCSDDDRLHISLENQNQKHEIKSIKDTNKNVELRQKSTDTKCNDSPRSSIGKISRMATNNILIHERNNALPEELDAKAKNKNSTEDVNTIDLVGLCDAFLLNESGIHNHVLNNNSDLHELQLNKARISGVEKDNIVKKIMWDIYYEFLKQERKNSLADVPKNKEKDHNAKNAKFLVEERKNSLADVPKNIEKDYIAKKNLLDIYTEFLVEERKNYLPDLPGKLVNNISKNRYINIEFLNKERENSIPTSNKVNIATNISLRYMCIEFLNKERLFALPDNYRSKIYEKSNVKSNIEKCNNSLLYKTCEEFLVNERYNSKIYNKKTKKTTYSYKQLAKLCTKFLLREKLNVYKNRTNFVLNGTEDYKKVYNDHGKFIDEDGVTLEDLEVKQIQGTVDDSVDILTIKRIKANVNVIRESLKNCEDDMVTGYVMALSKQMRKLNAVFSEDFNNDVIKLQREVLREIQECLASLNRK